MYEYKNKILDVVRLCAIIDNYNAVILCANIDNVRAVLDTLKEIVYRYSIDCEMYIDSVCFDNGSRIKVLSTNRQIRGIRCNCILFDERMSLGDYLHSKVEIGIYPKTKQEFFSLRS